MKASELKIKINGGVLERYTDLYADTAAAAERFVALADGFISHFGDREAAVFSVPGRSEISGNHTDHNNGVVLAGAIDRDIIAIASKNNDGRIRFFSEGYPMDELSVSDCADKNNFKKYTSASLIAGMVNGFVERGYSVGGFDVYSTSEVLKGSGISSSAAYEVMIGNVLNHLYNDGKVDNKEIAKLAQYSENVYFGKPSGLMDQMACAVGGFVYIDFEDNSNPRVLPIDFSLDAEGYSLCIVNTGGNHADLNEDYASVPREMKAVARELGRDLLRGITERELISNIPALREKLGDRAIMRALHFIRENDRVERAKLALIDGNTEGFFSAVNESGASSFKYLQNVYTTLNVSEQGLSLALALAEGYLSGEGASRVHGGGFAGTVQIFVKKSCLSGLTELMDSVFGKGAAMALRIRPKGAIMLDFD